MVTGKRARVIYTIFECDLEIGFTLFSKPAHIFTVRACARITDRNTART